MGLYSEGQKGLHGLILGREGGNFPGFPVIFLNFKIKERTLWESLGLNIAK